MKEEYIVDNDYLAKRGLDLNDYALSGTLIPAIIYDGLDILVSRISHLNDDLQGEDAIEKALDKEPQKLNTFFKAQYRAIYSLIFQNETSPVDQFLDDIIVFELGWGKINGFQKGVYYKNNNR